MAWKNLILLDKIWMVEPNAWLKKMEKNTGLNRCRFADDPVLLAATTLASFPGHQSFLPKESPSSTTTVAALNVMDTFCDASANELPVPYHHHHHHLSQDPLQDFLEEVSL